MVLVALLSGCTATPDAQAGFLRAPPAEAVQEVPPAESPVGVWNIVWDRSETGWRPPVFHGTLIIDADGTVGVDFAESTGDPVLGSLDVDGHNFRIEWEWPTVPNALTVVEGTVEGEQIVGQMTATDGKGGTVPWSPLHGRRVPMLIGP